MNELLIQVMIVAFAANAVLILIALVVPRIRRAGRRTAPTSISPASAMPTVGSAASAALSVPVPTVRAPEPEPTREDADRPAATPDTETTAMRTDDRGDRPRRFALPPEDDYPTTDSVEAFLAAGTRPEPEADDDRFDPVTGLPTAPAWEDAVRHEEARHTRYGHASTVVIVELDRLDALAARIGRENADRLIPPVAAALRRQARGADIVTRTGRSRFQILLPETDEVQAINYVERVRHACDMWLEAAAISVRLSMGWACPTAGGTLADAVRVAEQRMHADRARHDQLRTNVRSATAVPPTMRTPPAAPESAPYGEHAAGGETGGDLSHDAG